MTLSNPLSTALSLPLLLVLATPASAQIANCTHQGIRSVASKITYGPYQKCGTGISIRARGITLRNPLNVCPIFAIYEPPHDKPTPKVDHYVKPDRALPIVLFKMQCATTWLFGWLPIPTGSMCELTGSKNVGAIQNYVEYSCDVKGDK